MISAARPRRKYSRTNSSKSARSAASSSRVGAHSRTAATRRSPTERAPGGDLQRDEQHVRQLRAHVARLPRLARDRDRIDLADRRRFQRHQRRRDRHGLQLDAQRLEVGPARAARRDAQLVLDHLPRPALGAHAPDRHRQAQRVRERAQLDAHQGARVGEQGFEIHRRAPLIAVTPSAAIDFAVTFPRHGRGAHPGNRRSRDRAHRRAAGHADGGGARTRRPATCSRRRRRARGAGAPARGRHPARAPGRVPRRRRRREGRAPGARGERGGAAGGAQALGRRRCARRRASWCRRCRNTRSRRPATGASTTS